MRIGIWAWIAFLPLIAGAYPGGAAQADPPEQDLAATGPISFLPGIAGDYFPLDSAAVGRQFHIFVKLPESYASDPSRSFPLVVLLDGDTLIPMIAPQHLLLTYDEAVPEAIVVGIAYGGLGMDVNMRHIDFRSVLPDGKPGGAPDFLHMLEQELLPDLVARYRIDADRRMLYGQSRGGSFVLYAAHQRPDLFYGFIASNPATEGDGRLYGTTQAAPARKGNGLLVVASGTRDRAPLRAAALDWQQVMAGRSDWPWGAELVSIEGGTHSASAGRAYRAGILRAFGMADSAP